MRALKYRPFLKHMRQTARDCAALNGLIRQRTEKVKGICCNIFVKKMKAQAAVAFLRGAVRKMIGPYGHAFWHLVLAAGVGAVELMTTREVKRWRKIDKALRRQVRGMEKCRRACVDLSAECC
jgi:hypothetical protein